VDFKLNTYNKNISKQDLIDDLIRTSKKIGDKYLSMSLYEKNGKYSATPFIKQFGSWILALEAAKLPTQRTIDEYKKISDDILIKDIKRVAKLCNKRTITTKDYVENGLYRVQTILHRFDSWNSALKKAKLPLTEYKIITDIDLFNEIERLWMEKGAQPTTTDIKCGKSIYSLNTFSRHFGGFRNALEKFLQYIDNKDSYTVSISQPSKPDKEEKAITKQKDKIVKHKTPREINTTLRFKVLKRDNFKCCACGASPAKDPNVELHIDHIIPWSKGGETTIDNLQTLCSKCNLGKKDML